MKLSTFRKSLAVILLLIGLVYTGKTKAEDFTFIGKSLLEYSIFKIDVYEISYYKSSQSEKLILDYKTSVKRKYSQEGWKVGLEHKMNLEPYKKAAKWLLDNTIDLAKGDKLTILKEKSKVTLLKNGNPVAEVIDQKVADLAFEPWLGTKPVSEELKNELLGKKGE